MTAQKIERPEDKPIIRVTEQAIDAIIEDSEVRYVHPDEPPTTLTICYIVLPSGHTLCGTSGCIDPRGYDKEMGEKIAFANARNQLWGLEGYRLKQLSDAMDILPAETDLTAAFMAHEVNRIWCMMNGDFSQPHWVDAPSWQQTSVIQGVLFHEENPDAGPEASHESWRKQKIEDGWGYGPVKDPELKTHPNMVDFDQLPEHHQMKDKLFRAIVQAFLD